MLAKDFRKRINLRDIENHPWFIKNNRNCSSE